MLNKLELDIIISSANKIKNGKPIEHYPINIVKGKSLKDLYLAGYIYKKILSE